MYKARCSCGAYVRACHKCGRVPGQDELDLMDWRPTPERIARIDRRAKKLFGCQDRVAAFIDECCTESTNEEA